MAASKTVEKETSGVEEFELRGETALLVHCARLHLSERRKQAIKEIISDGINWELLMTSAAWHRLTPLLSHHLSSPGVSRFIPEELTVTLRGVYYQSLARNIVLQDELCRLLSAFNKEGIPVLLLKGSALLDIIYRDISLRPMSDLDLLVLPGDLDRAGDLARRMDYTYLEKSFDGLEEPGKRHLPNLVHCKKGIVIEVHQHIVNSKDACYFDISDFWARARHVRKGNAEALVFAPEDLLVHLAIKFLSDRRFQSMAALSQLCDVSEVIKHHGDSLDWNLIIRVSRDNGFQAGLHSVLYACQRILGTPVPTDVMRELATPQFDPQVADLFLRRRVLGTRSWLAHDLIDHRSSYNRRRMFRAIVGRFTRLAGEFFGRNDHNGRRGLYLLYRIKYVLPRLFRVLLKPYELKEDLLLDRWLHDLYKQT